MPVFITSFNNSLWEIVYGLICKTARVTVKQAMILFSAIVYALDFTLHKDTSETR